MLTLATILEATRGHLEGAHAAIDFTAVVIDSRRVVPGCLFVCLRGPSHDGHAYAETAVRDGAVGVVAAADWHGKLPMVPVVRVPDTQAALGAIARAHRRQLGLKVVAVTGSSGKTSTKEMIAAYLGARWPVAKTIGNENNEIGVPLTLLRLSGEHRAAVVEMGMRGLGEIAYLAGLAEPDVGVITNIGVAHLERLGSVEGIARAKTELWRDGPEGQIAVFPLDDPHLKAAVGTRGHV
ncbi:MAG: UDP-N-acetylmuramoyl-tripeptide--D-alanyl-D-alanine ligase, partial [Candidatus Sericytochromatia bacterium]